MKSPVPRERTRTVDVRKMDGAGNTFVLIDERPPRFDDYATLARTLCCAAAETGGADGLLVVRDAPGYAAEMRIYNADGSRAEMCGNGARCVARFLSERGAGEDFAIATLAGPIRATILQREPFEVRIDVGPVRFPGDAHLESIAIEGQTWSFYDVSVGNPHAVLLVDDVAAIDLGRLGAAFGVHARFPHGTNVHVMQALSPASIRVRHFERGAGLTRACGTGAVACAAVAIVTGIAVSPVAVLVPGGALQVEWKPGASAQLSGPAETICERTLAL